MFEIGTSLREARLRQGLSLAQVVQLAPRLVRLLVLAAVPAAAPSRRMTLSGPK